MQRPESLQVILLSSLNSKLHDISLKLGFSSKCSAINLLVRLNYGHNPSQMRFLYLVSEETNRIKMIRIMSFHFLSWHSGR